MRRNLIVLRAGDDSLHPAWIAGGRRRNFDLFISYYGEHPGRFREQACHYEAAKGLKWPFLAQLFATRRDLLLAYDACWFPDDDLATDQPDVNRMFDLFHAFELWLAQPALARGSHCSHWITAEVPPTRLRFTDFVEIMCPLFSRNTLSTLGHTFNLSSSGWGLDFLWPHLLGYPTDRIAILDETPVLHTRAVMSGPLYQRYAAGGINPRQEAQRILDQYGLRREERMKVFGTVEKSGVSRQMRSNREGEVAARGSVQQLRSSLGRSRAGPRRGIATLVSLDERADVPGRKTQKRKH